MISDDFEPRFEGMSFSHSIDGHGWPDSVTVSNGKGIFDGYSSREYVPYETAREASPLYCCICGQRLDWSK